MLKIDPVYYVLANGQFLNCDGVWTNQETSFPMRAGAHFDAEGVLTTIRLYRSDFPRHEIQVVQLRRVDNSRPLVEFVEVPLAELQELADKRAVERVLNRLNADELNALARHLRQGYVKEAQS